MWRSAWHPLMVAMLGQCAFYASGCTDSRLYGTAGQQPPLVDKLTLSGKLCTDNPATRKFPVKILFLVDASGQMRDAAPFGEYVNAMEQSVSQFLPIANVFVGVIRYDNGAKQLISEPLGRTNSGFSRDDALVDAALANLRTAVGGERDLVAAMSLAESIVTGDAFQAELGPLSRTKYVVVNLTSGAPTPPVLPSRCDDLFDTPPPICELAFFEKRVRDLRDTVLDLGAAEFNFHTVFLEPPTFEGDPCDLTLGDADCGAGLRCVRAGARADSGRCIRPCAVSAQCSDPLRPACVTATTFDGAVTAYCARDELDCFDGVDNDNDGGDIDCSDPNYPWDCTGNGCEEACRSSCRADRLGLTMSLVTGGRHERFRFADELNFVKIDFRSTQRVFVLKEFLVANRNAIATSQGFLPDTDADGLSDKEEGELGLNALVEDSDGDGFNDKLEHLLRTLGMDPMAVNLPPDCADPTLDTDGDGLRDCEEKLLGTDDTLFDTDADGFPDSVEFRVGTNALSNDTLGDADLDGVLNGSEVRAHSDPLSNDAKVRSDLSYRYRTVDLGTNQESRSCYDLRVSNVTLVETLDRGFGPGNNSIDVYFGQVPEGDLEGFGLFHAAQLRIQYLPPDTRVPDTPVLVLESDDFAFFEQ